MALFQAGRAPVLVCTDGWVPWSPGARPEGDILAERAAVLGVPRRQRLVTDTVAHTADEARAVGRHLRGLPSTTAAAPIILVTSALHMRRSRLLCARAGFQVVPFPVNVQVAVDRACTIRDLRPDAGSLSQTAIALREWYGWLFYQRVRRCTEAGSMPGGLAPVLGVQDDAHNRRRTWVRRVGWTQPLSRHGVRRDTRATDHRRTVRHRRSTRQTVRHDEVPWWRVVLPPCPRVRAMRAACTRM